MSRLNKISVICGVGLVMASLILRRCCICKKQVEHTASSAVVARVDKQFLYASDIESLDTLCMGPDDRASYVSQHIEEWVCKQLLIAQGNKDAKYIQPSLENQLNDYKSDLLSYCFLEQLVERSLNNHVSLEEISQYYQKHSQNDFILNYDIVKGIFLSLPKRAHGMNSVKSLMLSNQPADRKKLKAYCKSYAKTTILQPDTWYAWEEVLAKVGYCPAGDQAAIRLLKTNKFIHVVDQKYVYLLKIDRYKIAQEISPLEVVKERIKAIILHKRRLELINQIKNNLLQNAKKNNTCVIHTNANS